MPPPPTRSLDCRLFALTGGEPLMYDGFSQLVEGLLEYQDAQLVILSNGLLAAQKLDPAWPRERIRLQISLDGSPEQHDAVRGNGSFALLQKQLLFLKENGWQFTLSMCPTTGQSSGYPLAG
jgi:7,8-dihydro-6-hydroxymethylpterin dimethyltransferase